MVSRHPSCPACRRHAEAVGEASWQVLEAWIGETVTGRATESPLHALLHRFHEIIPTRRASLVTPMPGGRLRVVASSDLRFTGDLLLSLDRYPELAAVLETGGPFLAEDVLSSEALAPVAPSLERLGIDSLLAVPLTLGTVPMVFRLLPAGRQYGSAELRMVEAAAHLLEHASAADGPRGAHEAAWRRLAAALCDCVIEVLPNGQITSIVGDPARVFGHSAAQLLGTQADELFGTNHAETPGQHLFRLLEVLRNPEGEPPATTFRGPDGMPLHLFMSEIPSFVPTLLIAVRLLNGPELSLDDIPAPAFVLQRDDILAANRRADRLLRATGEPPAVNLDPGESGTVTLPGESGGSREFRVLSQPLSGRRSRLVLLIDAKPWTETAQRVSALRAALARHMAALEEARRHIEDLEVLKSRFLASSAHELKTPLTVLQSYLEILSTDLSEGLSDEQRSFLDIAYRNVLRLRRLVLDLTDLAALEGGQIPVQMDRVALEPILQSVLEDMSPLALDAGLDLQMDVPGDLPDVRADASRVEQVFHNLVDNAVKYTPTGGTVTVTGKRSRDSVVVEIHDTGIGIPPGQETAIFEPFVRSGSLPAGARPEGSGLGLTISRRIMSALGGRLTVTSMPAKGSTFRVHLPIWPDAENTDDA